MRNANIRDFDQYRRHRHFNPIFDLITSEFDDNFQELNLSMDAITERLYSEEAVHHEIITLFARGKGPNATDEFAAAVPHRTDESIYLLHGKKGMGKSTLLYRFYYLANRGQVEGLSKSDIIIYLDLRDRRSDVQFQKALPASLEDELFSWIYRTQPSYLSDPKQLRKISPLYKNFDDRQICERVLNNKKEALGFLLQWLRSREIKVFLIVDNLDDFPRDSIIAIFDFCHRLKGDFGIRSCLALRDYWNPRTLKIDDKVVCKVTLPQPNIQRIVAKRIFAVDHTKINRKIEFTYSGKDITLDPKDLLDIFNRIVEELTRPENKELYGRLCKLANYNTREFLVNMYHFFHSPYLLATPNFISALVAKVQAIDADFTPDPPRELRLHDFLQSFMAIHSLCYDKDNSSIFNLFFHTYAYEEGFNYRNTLIFVRILQMLQSKTNQSTERDYLVQQLNAVGYIEPAILEALDILLKDALVESPDGIKADDVSTIKLSAKGAIYLSEVITEFSYLLMVADVVPMEDHFRVDVNKKFGTEAIIFKRGNLRLKQESVQYFVTFIEENEQQEKEACPEKYREVLVRIKRGVDLYQMLRTATERAIRVMTSLTGPHRHRAITGYHIKE